MASFSSLFCCAAHNFTILVHPCCSYVGLFQCHGTSFVRLKHLIWSIYYLKEVEELIWTKKQQVFPDLNKESNRLCNDSAKNYWISGLVFERTPKILNYSSTRWIWFRHWSKCGGKTPYECVIFGWCRQLFFHGRLWKTSRARNAVADYNFSKALINLWPWDTIHC